MVINKGSFGAGQLFLLLGYHSGDRLFMLTAILGTWPILETSFAIGGLSAVVYSIAMAHANDHANPEAMVSIMVGLLLASGVGASISPFFAALAMKWVGPDGLYLYCL